jgi:hypothetical protein
MQHERFTDGGYVLHKIAGYWRGTVSAWFDRDGQLLDAEQIPQPFGSSRKIQVDGPMWQEISRIGKRYKHIPVA